jgi:methionine sulfoxide reductase heme-binding subunit
VATALLSPANRTTLVRRYIKPALFVVCLLPFIGLVLGAFAVPGFSLGTNPIEHIQDTLGQWGLRFLLITLAMTPLRDWFGAVWLIHLRRMFGLYAFFYLLMHFLNWLVLDQGLYWQGILEDIAKRPFITIGFLALLMLIPLAITSTNAMMRRLGRRWKSLHRLVYPITLLGIWHFWWQVKADIREPLLYASIAALLLGWRLWKNRRLVPNEARGAIQDS